MIENISNDNLKNILLNIELTKTQSNLVSIWLIWFQRIEIKVDAFRRFVVRQLAILVHSSNILNLFYLHTAAVYSLKVTMDH
jgi:hypothetical protein